MLMFLKFIMILAVFASLVDTAWVIWMFTGDDEAFRIVNFELEPGVDHMFWANKYMTDAKICRTHIDLNNEAIWYAAELNDCYLIEFLCNQRF